MTAQMAQKFSKISSRKKLLRPTVDLMKLNAQLGVAQKPTGTAATPDDCPNGPKILKNILKKKVIKTNCGPDETECPAGCCPEANWYCCSDNQYCAATPDDCPNGPKILKNILKKKIAKTNCGPDETECPAGCCPYPGWYCCSDNSHCAATPNDC